MVEVYITQSLFVKKSIYLCRTIAKSFLSFVTAIFLPHWRSHKPSAKRVTKMVGHVLKSCESTSSSQALSMLYISILKEAKLVEEPKENKMQLQLWNGNFVLPALVKLIRFT